MNNKQRTISSKRGSSGLGVWAQVSTSVNEGCLLCIANCSSERLEGVNRG